jgi:exo-beta-1,3-glucanase (GH17 family)
VPGFIDLLQPRPIDGYRRKHRFSVLGTAGRWFESSCPDQKPWFKYRFPAALVLLSSAIIIGTWFWLGAPAAFSAPPFNSAKLNCVSYAPFRGIQDPLTPGLVVGEQQIAEDFEQLARTSACVRTYSTGNGMDQVPALAQKAGLKVLLGVWIGTQPLQNVQQMETAIVLANKYPDVVSAIVVGNEVMLRREMTASDLAKIIRSVKARVTVPVTYADVWDVWLRSRSLSEAVDFVTIHILPYWDDIPIPAGLAAAHVDAIRQQVAAAFPGKDIFVGETGWPSEGRMRQGALPSRANQARVISDILGIAKRRNFRVNLIEAYDQPWKRQWEGTVGGHWGLFDSDRRVLKYPAGAGIRNHPFWKIEMGGGLGFCFLIFAVASLAARQGSGQSSWSSWLAVALIAAMAGALLGLTVESLLLQIPGTGKWIRCTVLLAVAIGAPLLCANALMSGRTPPTSPEIMGLQGSLRLAIPSLAFGIVLTLTTLVACETALGLVFDPRYRDFPFAALTMAVLPYLTLRCLNRPPIAGPRPLAEAVFAGLLGISATYIVFNEGYENWQSLWTCAAYFGLAMTLWLARPSIAHESISNPVMTGTTIGSGAEAMLVKNPAIG